MKNWFYRFQHYAFSVSYTVDKVSKFNSSHVPDTAFPLVTAPGRGLQDAARYAGLRASLP